MGVPILSMHHVTRPVLAASLALATVFATAMPAATLAADASPATSVTASPPPTAAPRTMCESLADLALYVGFVQDQSLDRDGLLPILVGAAASLAEAKALVPLVAETYRPLVEEFVAALGDLVTVARAGRDGTLGTELARLGEAITRVGVALDALSLALRVPCPDAGPIASGVPAASPAT